MIMKTKGKSFAISQIPGTGMENFIPIWLDLA
jgi:hypothetical protein